MSRSSFIRLDALSKSFAGVQALRGVSFAIEAGEVVCLAGENGSGKSTLIKILAGAEKPDAGTIGIDGADVAALDPRASVAHGIQVIFQDFSLFPNLSVAENIAFSAELGSKRRLVARRRMRRIAEEVLQRIAVDIDLDRRVETLPVADKQLVAIARALALNARLVIMDEPTTALTEREVRSLLGIIRRLKASGVAVLFVSHKLAEVFEVCEKIVVIRNGAVVADAPATEFDLGSLAFHMTGRRFPETFPAPAHGGDRILEVEGLSREGTLHDVGFALRRGEVLGVAGLLGSGRTALAKALFGLMPVDRGTVRVEGREVRLRSPAEAVAAGIGYVPEDRLTEGLFLSQSIERNVSVGRLDAFANAVGVLDRPALGREAAGWLAELTVAAPDLGAPVKSLSGGNQQRVVLARWLAGRPKILILNGPTVGVDIGSKADIHAVIASLAADGLGIVVISDDLPELIACCHRILVMKAGRIVDEIGAERIGEQELAARLAS
ncbi:lipase [Aureimonas endophytica]|uniref:Lipase n=1 Tax=Aureimonas endophytica TaxID=2027858 RepID=A0A916ZND8_9HYPH|nr:sugar ABC transporter ATP-binding protein [Aureimonas endophytica]GGE06061.1 lipase [Aureimonas endophytica]